MKELPLPKRPFRDSAVFHAVLSILFVIIVFVIIISAIIVFVIIVFTIIFTIFVTSVLMASCCWPPYFGPSYSLLSCSSYCSTL